MGTGEKRGTVRPVETFRIFFRNVFVCYFRTYFPNICIDKRMFVFYNTNIKNNCSKRLLHEWRACLGRHILCTKERELTLEKEFTEDITKDKGILCF